MSRSLVPGIVALGSARHRLGLLLLLLGFGAASAARAQVTRADSAAVLLDAARTLERDGRRDAARELLRLIVRRYPGTSAAGEAGGLLQNLAATSTLGTGRTGFVLFNTIYGGFLGVAIPAAFDAQGTGPAGAGLLIGAPLGFFGSRAIAASRIRTSGQAGLASFATLWGTWHGLALQQLLEIGGSTFCDAGCFEDESETAPWAAMVVGGLAGLGTGYGLALTRDVANGTSSLISHSSIWGSWFGLSLGHAFGLEDDDLLASMLVAGDAALLAAIPAASAWRPSPSRVRLITAGGLAGGLVGLGIDLLADVQRAGTAVGIPGATSALGLLIAAVATRNRPDLDDPGANPEVAALNALVRYRDGFSLSVPLPEPAAFRIVDREGRSRLRPGVRLRLFAAAF